MIERFFDTLTVVSIVEHDLTRADTTFNIGLPEHA